MKLLRRQKHQSAPPSFSIIVIGIILVLGLLGAAQFVKAATGGIPGQPGMRYDAVQATNYITTTNESYTDLPGMTVSFSTSAIAPATLTFSGEATTTSTSSWPGCAFWMRYTIDGVSQPEEIPVGFIDREDSRSFTYVTPTLTTGTHTITAQWREKIETIGAPGCVALRSLVVLHQ